MTDRPSLPMAGAPAAPDEPCLDACCAAPADERGGVLAAADDNAERTVVRVTGMDCASCAVTIEKQVARLPGVSRATVNFAAGRLDAVHSTDLARDDIEAAIRRAGFGIEASADADPEPFWSQPRVRSTVAGLALFLVGVVLWGAGASTTAYASVYLAASAIGGFPIYRSAIASARAGVADVNVLMSVAVVGAAILGAWSEAALVVILFSVSNALQVFAVGRTAGAVRALARITPSEVLVRGPDGRDALRAVAEVTTGEIVVIRPGERVAVDGTVVEGASTLDESTVTGESSPVEKREGETVFSGTLNGAGGLLVEVTKEAADSTLQRITRMVEEAQGTKAPIEQYVERFSRIYTPVVLAAAALVAIVPPLLGGDFSTWVYRALVLLIVSCPCALVISTPVSIVSGIGAASRRGILIKGGEALESAGKLTALFFDKTGTLTEGRPVVERVIPVPGVTTDDAIRIAAALERRSEHPLAHAILTEAGDAELPEVTSFRSIPGRGAEGVVEGTSYLVGSPRLFDERGISLEPIAEHLATLEDAGETPVILSDQDGPRAVFGLADAVRPEAARAIAELRALGVERLVMLTGDGEGPAQRIAEQLGIEYRAALLPEDKVAAMRELRPEHGTIGMIGDGINDAPALAAADVSFAMGAAGTDAALDAADIALMADDLAKVAEAIRLSRRGQRVIKQNIFAAILLNGAFTMLAPIGVIPLWLAVLEDALSSIGVTANSLRLFRGTNAPTPLPESTSSPSADRPAVRTTTPSPAS
ncbi:heavy metal translocating P-type ATPase [Paraconexibacter algicola]|uniref:Copper-translocating P-type ATPase n=1 Tax=Paraconexibacter algicola TaxID=2133960 RepID=A0A2T4UM46_9ACTN|nr:cation-translocating P-type ATPase [Paraconexibacter algicola]PTL60299.1 copper-translocating P-type ATPase [Paraconexibacter algicola]